MGDINKHLLADDKAFMLNYESVEAIPDSELLRLHKEYWTMIAKENLSYKPFIVTCKGRLADIKCNCFLCEYAQRKWNKGNLDKNVFTICAYCPTLSAYSCLDGLFNSWLNSRDNSRRRRKFAYKIANVKLWGF